MWTSVLITNVLSPWFLTWTFLTNSLFYIHQKERIAAKISSVKQALNLFRKFTLATDLSSTSYRKPCERVPISIDLLQLSRFWLCTINPPAGIEPIPKCIYTWWWIFRNCFQLKFRLVYNFHSTSSKVTLNHSLIYPEIRLHAKLYLLCSDFKEI